MIETSGLNIRSIKKEPYSGSHNGMRYYLITKDEGLKVFLYPEPWCFEATPDEQKKEKEFPFSQEGLEEAISWINTKYEERRDYWNACSNDKMKW